MDCSTPGFPVLHYLPEFTQTHVHWVSDVIQPSHPLSSPSSPVFNLSQPQGLFQWVISSYHVAKVLELQLPHTSFQWVIQGWFPLGLTDFISLLSKGLSRVFQHHSSKASILQRSAFFMTQLSRPYITTEKKHSFDYTDICHKVVSLLFNMLSRFVIAFLPRSKRLLISWLQSPSAVIFQAQENTVSWVFSKITLSFYLLCKQAIWDQLWGLYSTWETI